MIVAIGIFIVAAAITALVYAALEWLGDNGDGSNFYDL